MHPSGSLTSSGICPINVFFFNLEITQLMGQGEGNGDNRNSVNNKNKVKKPHSSSLLELIEKEIKILMS